MGYSKAEKDAFNKLCRDNYRDFSQRISNLEKKMQNSGVC